LRDRERGAVPKYSLLSEKIQAMPHSLPIPFKILSIFEAVAVRGAFRKGTAFMFKG